MDACQVIPVIRTTLTRRGDGKSSADPVRIITQYWEPNGTLLWETDPCAPAIREQEACWVERKAEAAALGRMLALVKKVQDDGGDFDTLITRIEMAQSEAERASYPTAPSSSTGS